MFLCLDGDLIWWWVNVHFVFLESCCDDWNVLLTLMIINRCNNEKTCVRVIFTFNERTAVGLWEDHDHTYCFIVSASEKSCSTPSDFPAVTWWSQEVSLFSDGGLLISWLPTVERPPRKKHLILHSLERVCVLACVQTAPLSESKGKLSVLCCIQKWRKFIHTQESCNVEALS